MPDKPRLEIKEVNAKAWEVIAFMRKNGANAFQTSRAASIYTGRVRASNSWILHLAIAGLESLRAEDAGVLGEVN
jgi:hypothetical protein